jgi:hypothetical protein
MLRLKTGKSSRSSSKFQDESFCRISSKWWKKLQKKEKAQKIIPKLSL